MIFNENEKNILRLVLATVIFTIGIAVSQLSPIVGGIIFFFGVIYALKKFTDVFK